MMKKLLAISLLSLSALAANSAYAQNKVGVVNLQSVVNTSAYSQRLRDEVTTELTRLSEELRALQGQVAQLRQKLSKDGLTMSRSQRQKLEKDIRSKIIELKLREANFNEERQFREREAIELVGKKAQAEIDKIAKAEGYDLVIHNEAVLFATEAIDITDQVSKALK